MLNKEWFMNIKKMNMLFSNKAENNYSFSERQTDRLAAWMGSWSFIWHMTIVLVIYFLINIYAWFAWDRFPFIFLNLGFSAFACYQVPIILMAQNRQSYLDSIRDNSDYEIDKITNKEVHELKLMIVEMHDYLKKNSL